MKWKPYVLTPKALANFSPGLERSNNPGISNLNYKSNPERVRRLANPFRVSVHFWEFIPRVVAALQPWAEISERLRRNCECLRRNGERIPRKGERLRRNCECLRRLFRTPRHARSALLLTALTILTVFALVFL